MTNGNQLEKSKKRIISISAALVFMCACTNERFNEIQQGKSFIKENQKTIHTLFIPFSRSNSERKIIAIYCDRNVTTIIPSKALASEMNLSYDHIIFDTAKNRVQTQLLTEKFPLIQEVINEMKELKIDVLGAVNDSITLSLTRYNSFIKNHDYIGGPALRSREEMLRLSKDTKSKYWLAEIDSNWIVISDP